MRTRLYSAPILFALLVAIAAAASWYFFRLVETPPWSGQAPSIPIEKSASTAAPATSSAEFTPFTFITYNVKNWLVSQQTPLKSKDSKAAIIELLASGKPDVIGLCEIGSVGDVKEIQAMLKAAGTDLPFFHYTGGEDRIRHLALISRFPILSAESPDLRLQGREQSMQRGILDATLAVGERSVRFIGLHLKSKRTVPEFEQAEIRIAEAQHVRRYIDGIFAVDHAVALVAYGDFNDTIQSLSTRTICGTYRTASYLHHVHAKDSRGEAWTYRYAKEDAYSRIDFVTVSAALRKSANRGESRIIDDPGWAAASDHRPVLVRFE